MTTAVNIPQLIQTLSGTKAGFLLLVCGVLLVLASVIDNFLGVQLISDPGIRDKLANIGLGAGALGAFLSWRSTDLENRSSRQVLMDEALARLAVEISAVGDKVTKVYKEVVPNGGESLRDAVSRVETMSMRMDQRQLALISDMAKPAFEADEAGHWRVVNSAFCAMLYRGRERMLGNGWVNAVDPETRSLVFEQWTQAVTQKRDFEMLVKFVRGPEDLIAGRVKAQRLVDFRGETIGYFGVIDVEYSEASHSGQAA